ncbi:MAG: efflux RND transporter periplasmic adaptor subunit, partial [Acidobacteriia bacterium]|nr:efflux RND transporter periplasmic adaptor subunit [Terriglobia bacterium]
MKKLLLRLTIVLVIAAAAWGGYTAYKKIPQARETQIPTTKVRRGDVVVKTFTRGELRAVRSATLTAPNLFGTVQVTKLASLGSFAREKDLVAEFDDSELLTRLEEKELEIEQVDEQTKKAQADLAIRNNQDQVELLTTKYSVRRAELEVKRNELLSAIDAKRNLLMLEESQRRLKQLESDIQSRRQSSEAELAVLRERKNKALLELNREKQRLNQVKILSPMSGLVAIKQNRGSGFMMFGQQLPDIREGDQLQPGMPIADILDLSELEVIARVGELDRANLKEGQDVVIVLDALAEKKLNGKIKTMSGTASANIFSSDPAKKFDVVFSVDMKQLLRALGANEAQIAKVLATAEANRKKGPVGGGMGAMAMLLGGGMPGGGMIGVGGMAGAGTSGGGGGAPGGMVQFGAGPGGPGGGGNRMGGAGVGAGASGMSDEQRTKMREAMQKALGGKNMQDLTPEERAAVFAKVQEELKKAGVTMPSRGNTKGGDSKAGDSKSGDRKDGAAAEGRVRGEGRGNRGGGEPAAAAGASRPTGGQGGSGGRGQGGAMALGGTGG